MGRGEVLCFIQDLQMEFCVNCGVEKLGIVLYNVIRNQEG